ncbi:hypothetical protein F4677DRAFT_248084 [Hypoxylon crocopeplum]|nr:hypothetical protein F4677DRAFT_248084 [Hypoxylon crocopeplum]
MKIGNAWQACLLAVRSTGTGVCIRLVCCDSVGSRGADQTFDMNMWDIILIVSLGRDSGSDLLIRTDRCFDQGGRQGIRKFPGNN